MNHLGQQIITEKRGNKLTHLTTNASIPNVIDYDDNEFHTEDEIAIYKIVQQAERAGYTQNYGLSAKMNNYHSDSGSSSDTDSDDSEEYIHPESDCGADALYSEASSEGDEHSEDDEHKPSDQEPISIRKRAPSSPTSVHLNVDRELVDKMTLSFKENTEKLNIQNNQLTAMKVHFDNLNKKVNESNQNTDFIKKEISQLQQNNITKVELDQFK